MECRKCGESINLDDVIAIGDFRKLCSSCAFQRMMSQAPAGR